MIRSVLLTILIHCISTPLVAQVKAESLGKIKFTQFIGGVILVQARIEGIETDLNFLLDTGSGGISLDSSTCEEFQLPTRQTDTVIFGIGGSKKVHYIFDKTLIIGNFKTEHLNFHVNDYTLLSGIYGGKIDGIIGYSFFRRYILKVNYDLLEIEFFTPGKMVYPYRGFVLKPKITGIPRQSVLVQDAEKVRMPFFLDTGAGLCLLVSKAMNNDSALISKKRKPVVTGVNGFMGRSTMRLTLTKKMQLGPYQFRNVPTYIFDDENNITSYPFIGGLVGSEIFRRFNLIINYPQGEIHLQPNSHFKEEFDYSYTGLNLYFDNNRILVDEVIPGSPADKAGLKAGDEIISVGKDLSLSIDSYRSTLQVANEVIPIYMRRGQDIYTIMLRTTTIK